MKNLLIFRGLIVVFVATYVAAIAFSGLGPSAPAAALEYERWVSSLPPPDNYWGLACAAGHVLDIVGLVLLFIRRRSGLWFLLAGFASCWGSGVIENVPFLQTHLDASLMSFVNIFWGAVVCMSIVCEKELFGRVEKS